MRGRCKIDMGFYVLGLNMWIHVVRRRRPTKLGSGKDASWLLLGLTRSRFATPSRASQLLGLEHSRW
jgi:hypothetical protein